MRDPGTGVDLEASAVMQMLSSSPNPGFRVKRSLCSGAWI